MINFSFPTLRKSTRTLTLASAHARAYRFKLCCCCILIVVVFFVGYFYLKSILNLPAL